MPFAQKLYKNGSWFETGFALPTAIIIFLACSTFYDEQFNTCGFLNADGQAFMLPLMQEREARSGRSILNLAQLTAVRHQNDNTVNRSRLKHLVSTVGTFFTPLYLEQAFEYQDRRHGISRRRFVPPSFNDIRLTLNTAQLLSLVDRGTIQLITFDGDLTLYDDGQSLMTDNPVIPRILALLRMGIAVGIVTAAGYSAAEKYYNRLAGLLLAIRHAVINNEIHHPRLVVIGGESNYLCDLDMTERCLLRYIPRREWIFDDMHTWTETNIQNLLDVAQSGLESCISNLGLAARVLRKDRAVGIVPTPGIRLTREQLEETVLVTQQVLEDSDIGRKLPFCAFNGGSDVFVDIGDKSWGVLACQRYLGGVEGARTLHIGDQFLSAGANDYKARLACTTAWIANPLETVDLLDELQGHISKKS